MDALVAAFAPAPHRAPRAPSRRNEGDRPRRRPRRADAAAFRRHAQAAAAGAWQAADRMASRGARRRRGARGRHQHRLARGADRRRARRRLALRPRHRLLDGRPRPRRRARDRRRHRQGAAAARRCVLGRLRRRLRARLPLQRRAHDAFVASGRLGRLWLVPNPHFHPGGDFGLGADGLGLADGTGPDGQRWTYANIALLRAEMFAGIAPGTRRRWRRCSMPACGRGRSAPRSGAAAGKTSARRSSWRRSTPRPERFLANHTTAGQGVHPPGDCPLVPGVDAPLTGAYVASNFRSER